MLGASDLFLSTKVAVILIENVVTETLNKLNRVSRQDECFFLHRIFSLTCVKCSFLSCFGYGHRYLRDA